MGSEKVWIFNECRKVYYNKRGEYIRMPKTRSRFYLGEKISENNPEPILRREVTQWPKPRRGKDY